MASVCREPFHSTHPPPPTPNTHASPALSYSSTIRLLDLASGKRARKLSAGHSGAVRQLVFSADGRYLASSAAAARFANVFDVAAGEDAPPEPVVTFGLAAAPTCLGLHSEVGGSTEDPLTVVAGFDSGGVTVLRTRRRADGKGG